MKKLQLLFLIISIIFIACNNQDTKDKEITVDKYKKVSFQKIKRIELSLGKYQTQSIDNIYYQTIDGKECAIISIWGINKLIFYDITSQEIFNEFDLDNNLSSFKYINKDSILLFYNNVKSNDYNNQLVLVNFKGEVQHNYNYEYDKSLYASKSNNKIELFNDNIFLILNRHKNYAMGTDGFFINKSPVVSYYNLKTEKLTVSDNIWYPFIQPRDYYPYTDSNIDINQCLSHDNLPLIRFYYSSKLFKWDYTNDKVTQYSLKSKVLDTIPTMFTPRRYCTMSIPAMYYNINYDKYNQKYYSVLHFDNDIYNKNTWSLIVADKDLNYIGETFSPEINGYNLFFTKDYIVCPVQDYKNNKFYLDYYKLNLNNISNTDYSIYINSIKDSLKVRKRSKKEWLKFKSNI